MKDIISVKESMAIIEEVWRKYKDYTPKWKAQRIIYICNKKFNKSLSTSKKEGTELSSSGSPEGSPKPCPDCKGLGYITDIFDEKIKHYCEDCKGSGKASDD